MELSPQAVAAVTEIQRWLEWKATQLTKTGSNACGVASNLLGKEAARLTTTDTYRIFEHTGTTETASGWPWPDVAPPEFERPSPEEPITDWSRWVMVAFNRPTVKITHVSLVDAMLRLARDRFKLIGGLTLDEATEIELENVAELVDDVVSAGNRVDLEDALDRLTPEACRMAVQFALTGTLTAHPPMSTPRT